MKEVGREWTVIFSPENGRFQFTSNSIKYFVGQTATMSFWRIVEPDLKIMNKPIPGFGPLRVVLPKSAGRHLSFTKAAAELYVTPAAISRQIGELEDRNSVFACSCAPATR